MCNSFHSRESSGNASDGSGSLGRGHDAVLSTLLDLSTDPPAASAWASDQQPTILAEDKPRRGSAPASSMFVPIDPSDKEQEPSTPTDARCHRRRSSASSADGAEPRKRRERQVSWSNLQAIMFDPHKSPDAVSRVYSELNFSELNLDDLPLEPTKRPGRPRSSSAGSLHRLRLLLGSSQSSVQSQDLSLPFMDEAQSQGNKSQDEQLVSANILSKEAAAMLLKKKGSGASTRSPSSSPNHTDDAKPNGNHNEASKTSSSDKPSPKASKHSLPGYHLGDSAKSPAHMLVPSTPQQAIEQAHSLNSFDFAFVKRSSGQWTYAIVADRTMDKEDGAGIRFVLDGSGHTKTVKRAYWGKGIRLVNSAALSENVKGDKEEDGANAPKSTTAAEGGAGDGTPKVAKKDAPRKEKGLGKRMSRKLNKHRAARRCPNRMSMLAVAGDGSGSDDDSYGHRPDGDEPPRRPARRKASHRLSALLLRLSTDTAGAVVDDSDDCSIGGERGVAKGEVLDLSVKSEDEKRRNAIDASERSNATASMDFSLDFLNLLDESGRSQSSSFDGQGRLKRRPRFTPYQPCSRESTKETDGPSKHVSTSKSTTVPTEEPAKGSTERVVSVATKDHDGKSTAKDFSLKLSHKIRRRSKKEKKEKKRQWGSGSSVSSLGSNFSMGSSDASSVFSALFLEVMHADEINKGYASSISKLEESGSMSRVMLDASG